MSQTFTADEVAQHKTPQDLYIIVDEDVYNLTEFQKNHPGGQKILQKVAGKDASKQFWKYHNDRILQQYKPKLMVGSLDTKKKAEPEEEKPQPEEPASENISEMVGERIPLHERETLAPFDGFGDLVPYADPNWYQTYRSPYYNDSHVAFRAEVRAWVEKELEPYVTEWDEAKEVPAKIYKQMGTRGYLSGVLGLIDFPKELIKYAPRSVPLNKWDSFHEMILTDEISRTGSGGLTWNLLGGFGIGCPPFAQFGHPDVIKRVLPQIIEGDKRICLAVTEPDAGSDVSALNCEAKLTEDGKHYIVNGEKKWITNGIWSDYFTVAVRTGGPGPMGLSLLLVERENGGVSTRRMDCQGVWSSGTTYITFEDAKVPVENIIGKKDEGFRVIMTNFNHERMGIVIQCVRFSRVCYEEAMKYAHKRKTFGVPLIKHPVIRLKLAHMARQIEATYAWQEQLVFQSLHMDETEAMLKLGGSIASLKAQSTTTFEYCAREASQIFGGLSYSRGGQGAKIERLYRDVRAFAIPGGSEEIMLDLSIRQALRVHQVLGMKL